MQLWFQEMGITSYGFDYRGIGKSTGWPSEKGICTDSDAVWDYVMNREQADPSQVIVCGFSIGGAPAARTASIYQPKLLILVAPFTSVKCVIRENFLLRFLAPFCRYTLPTIDYVKELGKTNLILTHGERDSIIRPCHSLTIQDAYQGSGKVQRLTCPRSSHNDVFFNLRRELAETVSNYL